MLRCWSSATMVSPAEGLALEAPAPGAGGAGLVADVDPKDLLKVMAADD
jgi:hypothetical protein